MTRLDTLHAAIVEAAERWATIIDDGDTEAELADAVRRYTEARDCPPGAVGKVTVMAGESRSSASYVEYWLMPPSVQRGARVRHMCDGVSVATDGPGPDAGEVVAFQALLGED